MNRDEDDSMGFDFNDKEKNPDGTEAGTEFEQIDE